MIIRTVTMDDLNEVVELESDAFKMTKKQTEQDMIGRIENYPDTFFSCTRRWKSDWSYFWSCF